MANRQYSNPRAIRNRADCAIDEHRRDPGTEKVKKVAPAEAVFAQPRASVDAEVVLELQRFRAQLRDHEKALVERIADVDDDRRAMESRLQRTWKMQRREVDLRLARHAIWILGLLVVFSVALFLVYRQAAIGQLDVFASVSTLREELAAPSAGKDAVDSLARQKLERLGREVEHITSSLGRPVAGGEPAPGVSLATVPRALAQSDTVIGRQIRNLGATQAHLAAALTTLRSVVQTFEAGSGGAPAGTSDLAAGERDTRLAVAPVSGSSRAPAGAVADAGSVSPVESPSANRKLETGTAAGSKDTLVVAQAGYALQLIGVSDRKSLERFLRRDGLPAQVYSIHRTHKNRPWHVVLHSLHEDYAGAAEARSRLPSDLAALDPWIRPLSAGEELLVVATGSKHR